MADSSSKAVSGSSAHEMPPPEQDGQHRPPPAPRLPPAPSTVRNTAGRHQSSICALARLLPVPPGRVPPLSPRSAPRTDPGPAPITWLPAPIKRGAGAARPAGGAEPAERPRAVSGPGVAAMRVRMISAASVLVLLFLPSETCSPLQWPRAPSRRLTLAPQLTWEPWMGAPRAPVPGTDALPQRLCLFHGAELAPAPRARRALQTGKRRDGKPNSLDLTFHLLREFLEMSREERLAQKALSNKLLLQSIGK
ncbi:E3 ubiquitin-protein ligase synoviolin-like [Melospiza georgiana]|uniref:E3 ubiquitin-protein ligase synoviolin-like n=1 Tax=Melospiza georgiana TaxID=44398 RepID=UPI0025AC63FD|nr:E3 ubiquitin-protein ligase synoviolin-like [Melospiza georgiana]